MVFHSNSLLRDTAHLYVRYLIAALCATPWAALYAILRMQGWDQPILLGASVTLGIATSLLWEYVSQKKSSPSDTVGSPTTAEIVSTLVKTEALGEIDFDSSSPRIAYAAYASVVVTSGLITIASPSLIKSDSYSDLHGTSIITYTQSANDSPHPNAATYNYNQFAFAD
jgi:hypothetical protein